ncbi:hypothetical protein LCGC14_0358480 [marine sediment metagenome]|uniref:Uncharacterized protein n=1 Tax=marine sediment metagenome TaxID=412755 RepID=A0A0F9WGR6_9ZZZZ
MTVASETNRTAELTTDGIVEDFDFDLLIFNETEVEVYFKATGGLYAQLTLNSDYGVIFTKYGGTVSTDGFTAPLVAGTLLIIRHIPDTQQTKWLNLDSHSETQHQDDFDRAVIRILQLLEQLARSPKFPIHSSTTGIVFPEPAANQFIGWDSAGKDLENKPASGESAPLVQNFNDLNDVAVGSPTIGDMVQWNGSAWVKVSNISVASIELVKPGNVPGSNGNTRRRIAGAYEIFERRTGDAWVVTGKKIQIA